MKATGKGEFQVKDIVNCMNQHGTKFSDPEEQIGRGGISQPEGSHEPRGTDDPPVKDGLALLLRLGFEIAGSWSLRRGTLDPKIDHYSDESNVLYAFVNNGEVKYVGMSRNRLKVRMSQYRNPGPSQTTNIRNEKRIRELLEKGDEVQIWVLASNEEILYRGFPLNVPAGLEINLIRSIRPSWNSAGR
jgi:hypothetical protein